MTFRPFVSGWPLIGRDCAARGCDRYRSGCPTCAAPGFAAEAHRQSALAAASADEPEDQAFVDAISWFGDEGDDEDEE
ncbi:MAG: antitoxin MazE-like protein [Nocardioidaceae bacterium]